MPANDEFNRGWSLHAFTVAAAIVNVPAAAGISHVLTDVQFSFLTFAGVPAADVQQQVELRANGVLMLVLGIVSLNNGVWGLSPGSWSGKKIIPMGQTLSVQFNAGAPLNCAQWINAQGYDI